MHDKFNSFIYSDLNCFSDASTFLSISFFIITSLSISVILIHFSETYCSFVWFINWQTWLKKYGKSISFGIISTVLFILSVSNSCNSFFVVSSYFSSFLLFIFLFLVFLLIFHVSQLLFLCFFVSFGFSIFLGFDIFIYVKKIVNFFLWFTYLVIWRFSILVHISLLLNKKLTARNSIQIKIGAMINVNVKAKIRENIMCAKRLKS